MSYKLKKNVILAHILKLKRMEKKKLTILFFIALLIGGIIHPSLYAQKLKLEDIPHAVINSFEYEYPGLKVRTWELVENQFVANFRSDGLPSKAYFSNVGEWVKTLIPIPRKELPTEIVRYVDKEYPDFVINFSSLQQIADERTHYYIEVKRDGIGQTISKLTFTDKGALMERIDPPGFTLEDPSMPESVAKAAERAKEAEATKEKEATSELSTSSIPPIVSKTLNKKAPRPQELKWFSVDTLFVAKCISQSKENEVYIMPDGTWIKTIIQLKEEAVTGNMQKHLKQYYKGYRFASARKVVKADKKDENIVEIYEKKNWREKLITTIIFDKSGKLLRTIDPEYAMGHNKKVKEDSDLDSYFSRVDKKRNSGSFIRTQDLPSDLKSYISQNYPSYRYTSSSMIEDEDLGMIYQIEIKEDGYGKSSEILYFNRSGVFLKQETGEIYDDEELEQEVEIPESVLTTFKSKYPRVVDSSWEIDDEDNYQVSFNGTRGKMICVYNREGTLLDTYTALSPNNVSPPIADYIKKNARGSKVMEYYSVRKSDRKTYYYVVIQKKKTKELESLWFTNTGKFVE